MLSKKNFRRFRKWKFFTHETKRHVLIRFIFLLMVFTLYAVFVCLKYGAKNGLLVAILTWSFFVFCTPIADAGFLLDFPVRMITKMRMIHSEMGVWITATLLNIYSLTFKSSIYEKTILLKLLKQILLRPIPFWSIILLSAAGTFISVYFGDELIDVAKHSQRVKYAKHKNKYKFIIVLFILIVMFFLYSLLLKKLGVGIPF